MERSQVEVAGRVSEAPTKSRAGRRVVAFPPALVPLLRRHLADYVGEEPTALVFTGPKGARLRRNNFGKVVRWRESVEAVGAPDVHSTICGTQTTPSPRRCPVPRSGT